MAKNKQYRFGEVCRQLDVQPYVLRYWETEFPALASDDAGSAQRVYGEDELAIVQRIKELLYSEGFTLVGAKKKLQAELDEGDVKLSSVAEEAPEDGEQEPEVEEEEQEAAEEDEQDEPEEEPRPVKKKKTTARKKTAAKKAKSMDDDGEESPSVDLKELKAILADARKLLKQLQA